MKVLRILGLLAGLAVVTVLIFFATMPRPGSRTRPYLGIVNTLRQIDGAKQQYAIDHNLPAGSLISREQLAEYLRERFWNKHADYHINAIGVPPEAVLPRSFDGLPAKTVIRLHRNDLRYDIVSPCNKGCVTAEPACTLVESAFVETTADIQARRRVWSDPQRDWRLCCV